MEYSALFLYIDENIMEVFFYVCWVGIWTFGHLVDIHDSAYKLNINDTWMLWT